MAESRRLIIELRGDYYDRLKQIAEKNIIHPNTLAEKVIMTFCDNMWDAMNPIVSDLNEEKECPATNTNAGDADKL